MDTLMMKLFDDNEGETKHNGPEVDAFAAALDRELKGETSITQLLDHDTGVLSCGSKPTSTQLLAQWQDSIQEENTTSQNKQGLKNLKLQEQHSSEIDLNQSGAVIQQQQIICSLGHSVLQLDHNQSNKDQAEQNDTQFSQKSVVQTSEQNTAHIPVQDRMRHPDNHLQFPKLQKIKKQAPPVDETNNQPSCNKQVSFCMLLPPLLAHLDKDKGVQLQNLFSKLRDNEINKDRFLRLTKNLVGGHLLRMVANKMLEKEIAKDQDSRNSQPGAHQMQVPSTTTPVGASEETPSKMPSIGQKRPVDALGSPSLVASKIQKVSGGFLDQSIEQLHDVTAISGVNLREEEEQLLSWPMVEGRASEATRRVIQEEEHRLILQKKPLQKNLTKIMSGCGILNISNDVERCLSRCVEERMRGLINNLVRLSKQRVDIERPRHQTIITSDVQHQILIMNQKMKEDWEKKQAEEAEELQKLNEAVENGGADHGKVKPECSSEALKVDEEEVGKRRRIAANLAARVSVGTDDMLLRWTNMAEHARQKRGQGKVVVSAAQSGKDVSCKSLSTVERILRDHQGVENRDPSIAASGEMRKFRRDSVRPLAKIARSISINDVIAVLEREPKMSKSILIYRLYNRVHDFGDEMLSQREIGANIAHCS